MLTTTALGMVPPCPGGDGNDSVVLGTYALCTIVPSFMSFEELASFRLIE